MSATEADKKRILRIIALRYAIDTERFDRTLPGAWFRPGEWLPSHEARGDSHRFAAQRLRDATFECERDGISKERLQDEIQNASRLGLEAQELELEVLIGHPYLG